MKTGLPPYISGSEAHGAWLYGVHGTRRDGSRFVWRQPCQRCLCRLLFSVSVPPPRVTAVASKRPRSFCQKRRWQVTGKYACALRMWFCKKRHGAWLHGVRRTCRDDSGFRWHQPCQRCKYTTSTDIQKRAIKTKRQQQQQQQQQNTS